MFKKIVYTCLGVAYIALTFTACKTPEIVEKTVNTTTPSSYNNSQDTLNSAKVQWRSYFTDPYLIALIDTALKNNQELNITLQEIAIAKNEVRERKGEYLPTVGIGAGADVDKPGRYTSKGSSEATTDISPGIETPDPLPNYVIAAYATWEIDIWNKLHNAKKAALMRYLSSVEGRNFMVTKLISEIAQSYYELLALDNQLDIVNQNIEIQSNALEIVKLQKEAARVTELAVNKFGAEVYHTKSLQFDIQQKIIEVENRINFLVGRFPQKIERSSSSFVDLIPNEIHEGIPAQLLENRPDIKQAELELTAAKLDVKVAKANFYPSLGISAGLGFQAFNPSYLFISPESILFNLAGEIAAPLINRNAIKAKYLTANAKQLQVVYNYERTILNAYIEVSNQLAKIENLENSYALKAKQVEALSKSIKISNELFKSARADYMEVLMTQRDALESKFELIETKQQQLSAFINMYQALGGGWN